MTTFRILIDYRDAFLAGLWVTLQLCLIIWPTGLLMGSLLGVLGSHWKRTAGIFSRISSFILTSIPVLVLLFWLHYPLQEMLGVTIPPFYTAAGMLALVNTLAVAEVVRRVLQDFPRHYVIAAKVCGLSTRHTVLWIQLPIVLRQTIPALLIIQVNMLQATLFASLISVDEIFRVAQRINAQIYQPVQIYTALGVLFLLVCMPLNGLAFWLRSRFTRDLSE